MARSLVVLGSTGSIGCNTLAVAEHLGRSIHGLTAHRSMARLAEQIRQHRPSIVAVADDAARAELVDRLAGVVAPNIVTGASGLEQVAAAPEADTVVTAIVGAAGLAPTLAAVCAGKRVGIANKEPLVMAGALITSAARQYGAELLPIDSEHSAIFQCLEGHQIDEVDELILTASGGPFHGATHLEAVTPAQALAHPTWNMGPKISIDSATLMNKALELIEARWLFDVPAERIRILVHPQSVIHSMVAYRDGSVLAQLGEPDMRTPIQYALTYPEHRPGLVPTPDFTRLPELTFEEPDRQLFPSLDLAAAAMTADGLAPCALNAANEVAVEAFLHERIPFTGIFDHLRRQLDDLDNQSEPDLAAIIACDQAIRDRGI